MKIFLSHPMKGKSQEVIIAEREEAMPLIKALVGTDDFEVIDSVITEQVPAGTTWEAVWYMGKGLELMSKADKIVFMPGWETAGVCNVENMVASVYGIPTLIL